MSESALLRASIQRLWLERRWLTIDRINCGQVTVRDKGRGSRVFRGAKPGTGDLTGYYAPNGTHIEIECKFGKGKQQDNQKERETDIKAKGGQYHVIYNLDELEKVINLIKPKE